MRVVDRTRLLSVPVAVVMLTAVLAPGDGTAGYDEAIAHYKSGDLASAVTEFHTLAGEEDPRGFFMLGRIYQLGQGVEPDDARAAVWYREAADRGHTQAQGILGFLYRHGVGVEVDDIEAYVWFSLAAEDGHTVAETNRNIVARWLDVDSLAAAEALLSARQDAIAVAEFAHINPAAGGAPAAAAAPATDGAAASPDVQIEARDQVPVPQQEPPVLLAELAPMPGPSQIAEPIPPESLPTALAAPPPQSDTEPNTKLGGFRVQLGTFAVADNPLKVWRTAAGAHPDLLAGLEPQVLEIDRGEKGTLYVLRIGPFVNHDAAQSLCSDLKAQNIDCFVVGG